MLENKLKTHQIEDQLKLYAKLTKGGTVNELDRGYWMISNKRSGGYAWCRIRSDGQFFFVQRGYLDLFILAKNPVQLHGRRDWQEFSSYANSMDFNNDSCKWKGLEKRFGSWSVTGFAYNPE